MPKLLVQKIAHVFCSDSDARGRSSRAHLIVFSEAPDRAGRPRLRLASTRLHPRQGAFHKGQIPKTEFERDAVHHKRNAAETQEAQLALCDGVRLQNPSGRALSVILKCRVLFRKLDPGQIY